jgi:hypothetical protein
MEVWQSEGGQWYASINGQNIECDNEAEARRLMAKIQTARAIVQAVQSLATAADSAADLEAEFFDVGAFTDADVAALGITASDLAGCITLLQQVKALMSGQATAAAMYRTTLNKVRRVG